MATIYLAGPITGRPNLNRHNFAKAEAMLARHGEETINPLDIEPRTHEGGCPATYPAGQKGHDTACYLREDLIAMLTRADAVVFLPGWEQSRGAVTEHTVALATGIPCWYIQDDWSEIISIEGETLS